MEREREGMDMKNQSCENYKGEDKERRSDQKAHRWQEGEKENKIESNQTKERKTAN